MLSKLLAHGRHNAVAYVALFVALSGTALAAKPLITGADIADDSVTGADVVESTLVGVDAATLGGNSASFFQDASNLTTGTLSDARLSSNVALDSEIVSTVLGNDGSGSGLDADTLDGLDSSAFRTNVMAVAADIPGQVTTLSSNTSCTNHAGSSGQVTIAAPGPGRILVDSQVGVRFTHSFGTRDTFALRIGTAASDCTHFAGSGSNDLPVSLPTDIYDESVSARRVFTVASAGTQTYYVNIVFDIGANGDFVWRGHTTATFIPD